MEYSIVVGNLAGDATNADLMNVFRNPNPDLRGDPSPPAHRPLPFMLQSKGHG